MRLYIPSNHLKDIPKLKSAGLDTQAKTLITIIEKNPHQNSPPYEKLSGNLKGAYSRRINRKHRLVYQVFEEERTIKIISMWTHYKMFDLRYFFTCTYLLPDFFALLKGRNK